jgi:single-stranded DNA-binding protein
VPTYNFVQILGHAGCDANVTITPNNKELVKFSIATGKPPYVVWHNFHAWGKVAVLAAKIKKGDLVEVHGNITYEKYRGNSKAIINVNLIYLLSHKADWSASAMRDKAITGAEREPEDDEYGSPPPMDEHDIPF